MYFQIVDNSQKCKKAYNGSSLVDYEDCTGLIKTWKHSSHLSDRQDVEYAYIYANGDMHSVCPGYMAEQWQNISTRVSSVVKSIHNAQCDIENSCIYDYIPDSILQKYLKSRHAIIQHTFESVSQPPHYEILKKAHILTEEMNSSRNLYKGKRSSTNYNIFSTRTGRLSNAKSSIPILTMKKEDRAHLTPTNDLFVEFDFNAAELRTLLALSNREQPLEDIHDWNLSHVATKSTTREEVKKRTFAWLYNPKASDSLLEGIYSRDQVKDVYYKSGSVKTPFFRNIQTDDRRALNYIVQSTSSDVCVEQSYKLREFFRDSRTKICYLLHDSVILDFAKEDADRFLDAKSIFGRTRFGQYRVNASIGKNFGEMREV